MARLLIVSRSMALAMRLADQHEVSEHPLDDLESLGTDLDADVLVLDIGDPIQSVTTVNDLREAGKVTPVLLVSGYQPEWEQIEAQEVEGVCVVPLPITRAALLTGVAQLLGQEVEALPEEGDGQDDGGTTQDGGSGPADDATEDPADDDAAADTVPPAASASAPTSAATSAPGVRTVAQPGPAWGTPITPGVGLPDFARVSPGPTAAGDGGDLAATRPATRPATNGRPAVPPAAGPASPVSPASPASPVSPDTGSLQQRASRLGNRPRKMQRRPHPTDTQGLGLVTDPLGPRTDPYGLAATDTPASGGIPAVPKPADPPTGSVPTALDRRLDDEAAALARGRNRTGGFVMRPADLVQSLLDQAGDLYGVTDTAQVLADDVIERASADAAAILVPDGPIWRVSGGVGLRPLEQRLVLEASHWLITEIGAAGRAVLIDDTDIIRQQLAGAPLAAWRHLLAVPVSEVRAIVVLARGKDGGPFADRDLAAVISPVREAAPLLAQAIQTRRLARQLAPLQESDDAPLRRPATG
jgi:hypothetical protein